MDRLVAVYDVFDLVTIPNPPLYVMPASQAYRTWRSDVPFPSFVAAHLAIGPPPPPTLNSNVRDGGGLASTNKSSSKINASKEITSTTRNANVSRRRRDKSSATSSDTSSGKLSGPNGLEEVRKNTIERVVESKSSVQVERYPADPSGGAMLVITKTKGRVMCRLEYSREFMLQCALSPWTKLSPPQMPYIVQSFPELLPPGPQPFSPNEYKVKFAKAKQAENKNFKT